MSVTLGEEIMLLSLDDRSGHAQARWRTSWAVAGGNLLELAMAGRVAVDARRVWVTDPAPTGLPLLDERLREIIAWTTHSKIGKMSDWLRMDQPKAIDATVRSLCGRGLVKEKQHKTLGLFPVRRYPEADGSVERELRHRLATVVLHGAEPDPRTSGLIGLLHAARLRRLAFPGQDRTPVDVRMGMIARGHWVADRVRKAIDEHDEDVSLIPILWD